MINSFLTQSYQNFWDIVRRNTDLSKRVKSFCNWMREFQCGYMCEYSKYSGGWSLNASLPEWRKNVASREQRDFKRVSRHLQNEMAFEKSAHTPGLHNWVFVICCSPKISLILQSGNKAPLHAVALLPFTIFSLLPLLSEFFFFFFFFSF